MENTSGTGKAVAVPSEINRWNWGAFLLNWIWGIGNNTYIAFLMFVPFVNIVMPFVLGAKGSAWAWRNKRWESVDHFKQVQRKWALWSVVVYAALIGLFVALFFLVMAAMKNSEPYELGYERLQSNPEAMNVLGAPITAGFPMGSIEVSGPKGKADLSFSVEGSKSRGRVYLEATRELGAWRIDQLELEIEGRPDRINLSP